MARATTRIGISLIGDKELVRKLEALGPKVYKKVVAQASRKAWAPVTKTAKAKAPKATGLLRKSLGTKQKKYARNGVIVTLTGPRTGFEQDVTVQTPYGPMKRRQNPSKYAHLVEFGTASHALAVGAESRVRLDKQGNQSDENKLGNAIAAQGGKMHPGSPPQPFMRPAFDSNKSKAVSIMRRELAAGIAREAMKK